LDAFLKVREESIPDTLDTIRELAEARKFSQKFTDEVVSSYPAEPEASRFGVINAFTRAAQGLGPIQRIEMEQFAGGCWGRLLSSFLEKRQTVAGCRWRLLYSSLLKSRQAKGLFFFF
jgi:hypothetical protein